MVENDAWFWSNLKEVIIEITLTDKRYILAR